MSLLVANKSKNKISNEVESKFKEYIECINTNFPLDAENSTQEEGINEGNRILRDIIEEEVTILSQKLPTMNLSDDYVRGAHFGDGSLSVGLTWGQTKTSDRLRCVPSWVISGANEAYCKAFINKFGGNLKDKNTNNVAFILEGIANSTKIFYLFENATWMPAYKKNQYLWWREAVELLLDKRHLTEKGMIKLVDLVCDKSEKGERKLSKSELIDLGRAFLKRNGYI